VLRQIGEVALLGFSPDDNGLGSDGRPTLSSRASLELVALVRVLLAPTLPPRPGAVVAAVAEAVPESVRAFAFVALGKCCLVDASLAKECVTLLVREVDHCRHQAEGAGHVARG